MYYWTGDHITFTTKPQPGWVKCVKQTLTDDEERAGVCDSNGNIISIDPAKLPPAPIRADLLKRIYIEIARLADLAGNELTYWYPQIVKDSWPTLLKEAQELKSGVILPAQATYILDDAKRQNNTQTPTDQQILDSAQIVIDKNAAFRAALGAIKLRVDQLQKEAELLTDAELIDYKPVW